MGNCSTQNGNKPIETPPLEDKKIELDPNRVLPEAPKFRRCEADDLKIKPGIINQI